MGGIRCEICGGETEVVDSRPRDGYVWRRRGCLVCGERETTDERKTGKRRRHDEAVLLDALETMICSDLGLGVELGRRLRDKYDL